MCHPLCDTEVFQTPQDAVTNPFNQLTMSRRHKESEIKDNYKPQQAESQEDGSPRVKRSLFSGAGSIIKNFTITKRDGSEAQFSLDKIMNAIINAFSKQEVEVDDEWLKIPLSAFQPLEERSPFRFWKKKRSQPEEEPEKSKRGRNPIKRLIDKISDSKVMDFFHNTWDAVKKKCEELYENVTQFSICFLRGIYRAFCPDDDPYGKISHYHEMLNNEICNFPTRKTLSNYYNWFVNWIPVVINETPKEKKERHRHSIWKQLIEWIYFYLLRIAPKYAVQMQKG